MIYTHNTRKPVTLRKAAILLLMGLLLISAVRSCSKEQGYDEGYAQATAEIYAALKEQSATGADFFIKDMPAIKFMPRKDGAIKYAYSGAESLNTSRY